MSDVVYLGVPCGYSAVCPNEASTTVHMGPIGAVDMCQSCLALYVRLGSGNSGTH